MKPQLKSFEKDKPILSAVKLETWFTDEELKEFIQTAEVPDTTLRKVMVMADARGRAHRRQRHDKDNIYEFSDRDYTAGGPFDPRGLSPRQREEYDRLMRDSDFSSGSVSSNKAKVDYKNEMDRLMSSTT